MSNCYHCQNELSERWFYLSRQVEIFCYSNEGNIDHAKVLYSDIIHNFCSSSCARTSIPQILSSLGLKIMLPYKQVTDNIEDIDTIDPCTKCDGPVILATPHVSYNLMEASEDSNPWIPYLDIHYDECLCVVCQNCDSNLMESEWQVADEDEAELYKLTDFKAKGTV